MVMTVPHKLQKSDCVCYVPMGTLSLMLGPTTLPSSPVALLSSSLPHPGPS